MNLHEKSDADLMAAFYTGDNDALTELFRRYRGRLIGYFRQRGLQPTVAEDRAQDTLLQVLASRAPSATRYDPHQGDVAAWLFTMAYYQFLHALDDQQRARRVAPLDEDRDKDSGDAPQAPPADEAFWEEVERQAVREAVQTCLCQLDSEAERTAVRRWLETEGGHKLRELAQEMGVALATAGRRRQQAFQAMQECLQRTAQDEAR